MPRRRCGLVNGRFKWLMSQLLVLQVAVGCGREEPADRVAAMNDSNIKRLANLYMAHQIRNSSKGPADETAFKNFIQNTMARHRLEMMQVDPNKVDALFISERRRSAVGRPLRAERWHDVQVARGVRTAGN